MLHGDYSQHVPLGEVTEGVTTEEVAELRKVLGGELPPQLTEWLQVCNGTT